jgi:hypothetical protein
LTSTSANFVGQIGKNYAFYSIATDNLGQKELAPTTADTATNVVSLPLTVTNFLPKPTGFSVSFNAQIDIARLNLYDGQDSTQDPADLQLIGPNGLEVKGSIIWNPTTRTLEYIKTDRLLDDGNYTLSLFSRSDSFVNTNQQLLDGNNDGQAGGDYQISFNINNSNQPILSLPDFSRALNQTVNIPKGIPITLSDGTGVTKVDFTLSYNPDLLQVTGVNLDANLTNWQVTRQEFDDSGKFKISIEGNTPLPAGENQLALIQAGIPLTATYGVGEILTLQDVKLNGSDNNVLGDSAIHHTSFLGDVSGNGKYSGLDAAFIARVGLGLDTGFDRFARIDPLILADIDRDRFLSGLDAHLVSKGAVNLPDSQLAID